MNIKVIILSACLLILLLTWGNIYPQNVIPKVIKAGKLIDVENGEVLLNQIILIENDTIKSMGKDLPVPENAVVYDLAGYTILPGLIDAHTHLTMQPGDYIDFLFRKSFIDLAILSPQNAQNTIEAGFTTCRDLGANAFIDVALRNAINIGKIEGPRMQVSGPAITCTGGHGDITGFSSWLDSKLPVEMTGVADGVDEVRKEVRYIVKNGADVIKFHASGGVLEEGESVAAPRFTQEEMNAIVNEAKFWNKKVCAHAMGIESVKMAVMAGVTSIEHGCIMDDECIQLMKEKGIYLVADLYVDDYILSEYVKLNYPPFTIEKEKQVGLIQRQNFQKAVKAGVKIAFGTDAGVYPHGWNAKQFSFMVKWGLTPLQVIQSSTINAAKLMGWENKVGSIKKGKYADIIATLDNPLDNLSTLEDVKFVMKGGKVIKNKSDSLTIANGH